jgi:hypothetical protein
MGLISGVPKSMSELSSSLAGRGQEPGSSSELCMYASRNSASRSPCSMNISMSGSCTSFFGSVLASNQFDPSVTVRAVIFGATKRRGRLKGRREDNPPSPGISSGDEERASSAGGRRGLKNMGD